MIAPEPVKDGKNGLIYLSKMSALEADKITWRCAWNTSSR